MDGKYDDIINMPGHISDKHPQMPREKRAAQFAPFAALTGYAEAIEEAARYTEEKIELSETELAELNIKFEKVKDGRCVEIKYFIPDKRKTGGEYKTVFGAVERIDNYNRVIILSDKTRIPIDMIVEIIL